MMKSIQKQAYTGIESNGYLIRINLRADKFSRTLYIENFRADLISCNQGKYTLKTLEITQK